MSIPDYQSFMKPILESISDGDIYSFSYIVEKMIVYFDLSKEEIEEVLPSGNQTYLKNRVGWAKTYLKKAGLLKYPSRAKIQITEEGVKALKSNTRIDKKYLENYEEFLEFQSKEKINKETKNEIKTKDNKKTPDEIIDEKYNEIKNALADEILDKLKDIDFFKFEEIVLDLLIKMGYGGSRNEAKEATKKTGDEGIDGIIKEDRLGLDRIYIQAKRWKDNIIGRPEIHKFSGALDTPGATKGIFITTSKFSKEAIEYANRLSNKKIILIDGMQLAQHMIDFNVGVSIINTYDIKRIDTDYFTEEI